MQKLLAAALAANLTTTVPAPAYHFEHVRTLQEGYDSYEAVVRSLADGRFVAAWSGTSFPPAYLDAQARLFDSQGTPIGTPVSCTEQAGARFQRHAVLETTTSGAIVFACDLQGASGLPLATLRSYSAELEPIGTPITFDGHLFSEMLGLASADDESFVASIAECEDSDCIYRHRRFDLEGNELGTFLFPRFELVDLVRQRPDRFLVLGIAKGIGLFSNRAVFARLVDGNRKNVADAQKVLRRRHGEFEALESRRIVRGAHGRTAALFHDLTDHGYDEFRVTVIAGDDTAAVHRSVFEMAYFYREVHPLDAWALPLESGFVLVWSAVTGYASSTETHGIRLQRFDDSGARVGEASLLLEGFAALGSPSLDSDGESYLMPLQRSTPDGTALEVWRLSGVQASPLPPVP